MSGARSRARGMAGELELARPWAVLELGDLLAILRESSFVGMGDA